MNKNYLLVNPWNTKDCWDVEKRRIFLENCTNLLDNTLNIPSEFDSSYENCSQDLTRLRIVSPSQEYFQYEIIIYFVNRKKRRRFYSSLQVYRLKPERNYSLANLGNINWENLACLAIIYLICYFAMWKGVKTSGKVFRKKKKVEILFKMTFVFVLLGCLVYCIISICCFNNFNDTWFIFKWFNERYCLLYSTRFK